MKEASPCVGDLFTDLSGQEADAELIAQRVKDRADQQGAKKALGHGAQCIDTVTLGGDHNVLPLHEGFHFFHKSTLSFDRNL